MIITTSRSILVTLILNQESAESFLRNAIPDGEGIDFTRLAPEFGQQVVRMVIAPGCDLRLANQVREDRVNLASLLSDLKYDFIDKGVRTDTERVEPVTFQVRQYIYPIVPKLV